jgi:hypothetical protein
MTDPHFPPVQRLGLESVCCQSIAIPVNRNTRDHEEIKSQIDRRFPF